MSIFQEVISAADSVGPKGAIRELGTMTETRGFEGVVNQGTPRNTFHSSCPVDERKPLIEFEMWAIRSMNHHIHRGVTKSPPRRPSRLLSYCWQSHACSEQPRQRALQDQNSEVSYQFNHGAIQNIIFSDWMVPFAEVSINLRGSLAHLRDSSATNTPSDLSKRTATLAQKHVLKLSAIVIRQQVAFQNSSTAFQMRFEIQTNVLKFKKSSRFKIQAALQN
jgi:hypothetical protein